MALPKINNPIFELTLPSTGATIKYRPFLVKEQKILLLAMESQDQKSVLTAIKQIVNNCAIDEIDTSKIPTFDLEYFFMRLRAKSIGETIDLKLRHPTGFNSNVQECDGITDAKLNLLEVDVVKSEGHTDKIILDEETGIGIKLKYPNVSMAIEASKSNEGKNQMDVASDAIINSIEYIFDNENVYKKEDYTKKELLEFIENLNQDQYLKLTKFFELMPKLKHKVKWTCQKCNCDDEITMEGLQNFFGF
jgi:hypothetical protein